MLDVGAIREKLDLLRRRDRKRAIFGSKGHGYVLHPPIPEKRVAAFEQRWRMRLPDDYRRFMIELGNGGAGPAYGLFKLGEEDEDFGHRKWCRDGLVGDPSKPFVHRRAWNLPKSFWAKQPKTDGMTEAAEDRANEHWERTLSKHYWAPSIMNGAVPICHLGCALRQWLVVTGPAEGQIWNDERADERGISPLRKGPKRVRFADWYMDWLDVSLRSIRAKTRT